MVVFTCQHCGESLKKAVVDKHYNTKCRFNNPSLTCVDCLKDFVGGEYNKHFQCISEAERYSAKGTKIKEHAGKNKQEKYTELIHNLLNSNDLTYVQRQLLVLCSKFDNVPRKEQKFLNFMKSCAKHVSNYDANDLKSVFNLLEKAWKNELHNKAENQKQKDESFMNGTNLSNMEEEKEDELEGCSNEDILSNTSNSKKDKANKINQTASGEDIKENANIISKKKLKKQKKYEKYLAELENTTNEVNGNTEEHTEKVIKKSKKKTKETKPIQESIDSTHCDTEEGVLSSNMEVEVEQTNHKKNKKRKLEDSECGMAEKITKKQCPTTDEEVSDLHTTFSWADMIVRVLESRPDKELSLKRLSKKVIDEYQTVKSDHRTYEDLLAKFNKKVMKTKGVRVLKDKAKLIE